ncbi:hypothetical protein SAMN05444365_1011116 [Micromonospora pattaloongensis]|uniref:Exo-alpha-sialidase n=1 Tax=Micromonospora pattaloongensis TaxID=405436 RepID=A0A1H3I4R6_9ACTN|nr:hypothetical protein [Micromonospora pattaloongensis]SDY22465.1 hypothetical protein SAMN05444365_1011116 [Micromonospora pattaloongensis]
MRRRNVRHRLVLLAAVVVATAGCSIGDIRRRPPTPAPPPAPSSPVASPPDEVRRVPVPVPRQYATPFVEFADAEQGYALFTRCGNPEATSAPASDCGAILLATSDGGRSWRRLRHPEPLANNHQLYAAGEKLLLLAEPHGWYISNDRGGTFRREPMSAEPPAAVRTLEGRFQLCCDGEDPPRVVELVGDRLRPVPAQPPVPGLRVVAFAGGRLVAVGERDGELSAAVSSEAARQWRPMKVAPPDGPPAVLRVVGNHGDVWLIGSAGPGDTRFPQLWRCDQWCPRVEVPGYPGPVTSLVPLGAGLLAVTGPDGSGVISAGDDAARYSDVRWPVRNEYLQLLPDGTLFARASDGNAWLGSGMFGQRRWIKLVLERT